MNGAGCLQPIERQPQGEQCRFKGRDAVSACAFVHVLL